MSPNSSILYERLLFQNYRDKDDFPADPNCYIGKVSSASSDFGFEKCNNSMWHVSNHRQVGYATV